MAVRIRADGQILCAAATEPESGDTYLDDNVVHCLHQQLGVLIPAGQAEDGADIWMFRDPIKGQKPERFERVIVKYENESWRSMQRLNALETISAQLDYIAIMIYGQKQKEHFKELTDGQ